MAKAKKTTFLELKSFSVLPVGKVANDVNLGVDITLNHSGGEVAFLLQPKDCKELIRQLSGVRLVYCTSMSHCIGPELLPAACCQFQSSQCKHATGTFIFPS